jgi:tetratricopeptide (TPR) repeat protein
MITQPLVPEDFEGTDTKIIVRLNLPINLVAIDADIYVKIDGATSLVISNFVRSQDFDHENFKEFMHADFDQATKRSIGQGSVNSHAIIYAKGDPLEAAITDFLRAHAPRVNAKIVEEVQLSHYRAEQEEGYHKFVLTKNLNGHANINSAEAKNDEIHPDDLAMVRLSVPETYGPCPCMSGKKFKFCCKEIYPALSQAWLAADDGFFEEAFEYLKVAEKIGGLTPEVLCHYAIVHMRREDKIETEKYLDLAEKANPLFPRVYYFRGVLAALAQDHQKALGFFEKSLELCSETDRYHQNELMNDIGGCHYQMGNISLAISSWQKALSIAPRDRVATELLKGVTTQSLVE